MHITITLDISPQTSPIAVQQLLDWAVRINAGETAEPPKNGHLAKAAAEKALFNKLVETKTAEVSSPPAPPTIATAPATAPIEDLDEEDEEVIEDSKPQGALPPGVEGPPKRRRGRISNAEKAARAAAAAAAEAGSQALEVGNSPFAVTVAPASTNGGARPLGFPPAPQAPAMPVVEEEYSEGTITKEDVKAVFAKAVNHDPRGTHTMLKAATWSDGTDKPQWFTIEKVLPIWYDRLYAELAAFIPAE